MIRQIVSRVSVALLAMTMLSVIAARHAEAVLFRVTGTYDVSTPAGVTPANLIGTFSVLVDVPSGSLGMFGITQPVGDYLGGLSDPITLGTTTYDATDSIFGIGAFPGFDPGDPSGFGGTLQDPLAGNCTCEDDFSFGYRIQNLSFADALVAPVIIPLTRASANSSQGGGILNATVNSGSLTVEVVPVPAGVLLLGPIAALGLRATRRRR
jgi:hypothetical protein